MLVVDVASTDTSVAVARAHQGVRRAVGSVDVLRIDHPVPLGEALSLAVEALPLSAGGSGTGGRGDPADGVDPADAWVWVLHEGAPATPSTLARLLAAGQASRSVGIVGPKLVAWHDSKRLLELGIQVTRTGRRLAVPVPGEVDQGQYDGREDVLAVHTDGMLVRRSVWDDLGGLDRTFARHGAALDLGWRTQLAGHRVVVVPAAVVRDAGARLTTDLGRATAGASTATSTATSAPSAAASASSEGTPDRRERRAMRQVALARCSPLAAPFLALWLAASAGLLAAVLLLAKRPRLAWRELSDATALLHPVATTGARWRGRGTRRLARRDLGTLFVPVAASLRSALDRIQDSVAPERRHEVRRAVPTTETGPATDESEALGAMPSSVASRVLGHPGFLAVTAALLASAVAWRSALRAGALSPTHTGLAGGELRPVTTDAAGLWHAFRDAWHGAGLGTGVESGPHLAVLSGLTWLAERVPAVADGRSSAGVTVAWLLVLTPALATWTAYLGGRVVTTSRPARGVAALAWGASAVATTAVADGRVTLGVGHVLLPLVLAGIVLAARRDGTWTAAFATALAAAVLGAFVPPLLVVVLLAAVVLLVAGRGMVRGRALVLLVLPVGAARPVGGPLRRRLASAPLRPGSARHRPTAPAPGPCSSPNPPASPRPRGCSRPSLALGLLGYAVRSRSRAGALGLAAGAVLALVGLGAAFAAEPGRARLGRDRRGGLATGPPLVGRRAPAVARGTARRSARRQRAGARGAARSPPPLVLRRLGGRGRRRRRRGGLRPRSGRSTARVAS